jgi:hypothetical protein
MTGIRYRIPAQDETGSSLSVRFRPRDTFIGAQGLVENTKQKKIKIKTERQLAVRNALTAGSGTDFVTGKASNDSVAPVRLPVAAEDFRCYAWTLARTGRSHP